MGHQEIHIPSIQVDERLPSISQLQVMLVAGRSFWLPSPPHLWAPRGGTMAWIACLPIIQARTASHMLQLRLWLYGSNSWQAIGLGDLAAKWSYWLAYMCIAPLLELFDACDTMLCGWSSTRNVLYSQAALHWHPCTSCATSADQNACPAGGLRQCRQAWAARITALSGVPACSTTQGFLCRRTEISEICMKSDCRRM